MKITPLLRRLSQWPHWSSVRFTVGFLAALATIAALLFSISESARRDTNERLAARRDGTVHGIVIDSGSSGVTLADIANQYRAQALLDSQLPSSDEMRDVDFRAILQRLRGVIPVGDRWYVESGAPLSELRVSIDNISFGIPLVPEAYLERSLTDREVSELLAPFLNSGQVITLSEAEAESLNRITRTSTQAAGFRISSGRTYTQPRLLIILTPLSVDITTIRNGNRLPNGGVNCLRVLRCLLSSELIRSSKMKLTA